MTHSNTPAVNGTTNTALRDAYIAGWAYNAGLARGIALGAIRMMTPDQKNRGEFRQREIAERLTEYATNAERLHNSRQPQRFWPTLMPGGWPIPPDIPSDDPLTWWPEVDGWPCPPPHLRGDA